MISQLVPKTKSFRKFDDSTDTSKEVVQAAKCHGDWREYPQESRESSRNFLSSNVRPTCTRQLTRQFRTRESVPGKRRWGRGKISQMAFLLLLRRHRSRAKKSEKEDGTDGARLKSSLNVAEGRDGVAWLSPSPSPLLPFHSFLRFPLNRCPDPDSMRREGRECAAAGPKHGIGKTRDRSLHTRKSVPGKTSRGKGG